MTKHDVLNCLADGSDAEAQELADAFGIPYATAAMALLRLVRQNLASRFVDPGRGTYAYRLTDHGHARLAFFNEQDITPARRSATASRRRSVSHGGSAMKQTKFHTGTYHCPACYIEFDLVAEQSLKCDQCQGPLHKGSLDEGWDDDDQDDDDQDED
jgi:DNA-binding MarR family transcriptional regulator